MPKKDYYEIIGVTKEATQDDIKKAYRKMAKKWHPDLHQNNRQEAEKNFKEIGEAYEVLSDSQKRAMYDRYGFVGDQIPPNYRTASGNAGGTNFEDIFGGGGGGGSFGGFEDIFDMFFGSSGTRQAGRSRTVSDARTAGEDILFNIQIGLIDVLNGIEKDIEYEHMAACSS